MSSGTFQNAVEFVLSSEGVESDDPQDAGGLTRWGISSAAHPTVDVKNLTRDRAIRIYYDSYWLKLKCEQMPSPIAFMFFDACVNQGPHQAAQLLQRALGVKTDGVIGPVTIAATMKNLFGGPVGLAAELAARRMVAYGTHSQFDRYGLGWSRRLMSCLYLATRSQ